MLQLRLQLPGAACAGRRPAAHSKPALRPLASEIRPDANPKVPLTIPRRCPIDRIRRWIRRLTDVERGTAAAREGVALVKHVIAEHRQLPMLILSAHGEVEQAVGLLH